MHFSSVIAPLFLAGAAIAQNSVQVQVVKVGGNNGELTFSPSDIQAPQGSMVQFQFYPMNHSVAQSTFAQPCMPIEQTQPNVTDPLWSGFMPTQKGAAMMATYTVMVNNTQPIWLYCAQATHCQKGMVAAINANNATGKTLDQYKQAAAKATANIAPGGSSGTSGGTTGSGSPGAAGTPGAGTPAAVSGSASTPEASPAASPSSTGGQTKVASGASSVSYGASTMALAGILSVIVGYAL
jgi:plastocyanin